MVIISSLGGSGSTWIAKEFKKAGWKVCLRPDVGTQKGDPMGYYKKRTAPFFKTKLKEYDDHTAFEEVYSKICHHRRTMLLTMTWGAKRCFRNTNSVIIYILRDPVETYNSFIKEQHLELLGFNSKDDRGMVNAFLGSYAMWDKHAKYAQREEDGGFLIRYDNFKKDWKNAISIADWVPPIHKNFRPSKRKIELKQETIDYIYEETGWPSLEKK